MTIADLVQFYSPISGGVRRYLEGKSRYLESLPGWRHVLIVPSRRTATTWSEHSVIFEVRAPRLPLSKSYRMIMLKGPIPRLLDEAEPNIIEVGDAYRGAWIGLTQARRLGIPVVAFYHSDYPRAVGRTVRKFLGPWLEEGIAQIAAHYVRDVYNRMDATVVATRRFSDTLRALGIRNVRHIPLGTDTTIFQPFPDEAARRRARLGLGDAATRLLLYVGRLGREKNVPALVGMVDELHRAGQPVHLHIIGDGEHRERLRQAAAERSYLSWGPHCADRADLAAWYSAADIFVHAGDQETFGLVSLEAQACGTPVLAVRGGGLDETLEGEAPGHPMAASATPTALAAGCTALLACPSGPAERAARRARIVQKFSSDVTYGALTALYRELVEARRHGRASSPLGG